MVSSLSLSKRQSLTEPSSLADATKVSSTGFHAMLFTSWLCAFSFWHFISNTGSFWKLQCNFLLKWKSYNDVRSSVIQQSPILYDSCTLFDSSDFPSHISPNILILSSPQAVAIRLLLWLQSTSYTHLVWNPLRVATHFQTGSFFNPNFTGFSFPSALSNVYSCHILMHLPSYVIANICSI